MGEVVWDPRRGQDGHPLLQVVFLALLVNHQDGDVVATLFHLVGKSVSIIFEVREKEGRGNGLWNMLWYIVYVCGKSSCHDNNSLVAAFILLEC